MKKLLFTNSLTKKKEEFKPLEDGKVKLYACGVTPYDHSHIGHGRSFVFVDTLVRLLKFLGYEVTFIRNVTDIDDKLLAKAEQAGDLMSYKSIAKKFTDLFRQEVAALGCLEPDAEPTVTNHIDQIISFVRGLVEKKKAYVLGHDVYFDVTSYDGYGELSGRNLEDLQAGARVEVNLEKKNPADFALWKGNDEGLFWKSDWGYGRPGWHIECSALAKEYLGETIDIHCGGSDLIFPHHENERAQSESLHGKPFANYWIHNALLNIDKKKMSKSVGNILSLQEIFKKYDPMVLRFYFLQHQYRTPIEFSFEMLDAAQVAYKKLVGVFGGEVSIFKPLVPSALRSFSEGECIEGCEYLSLNPITQQILDALCDDLNTPKAIGVLFEHLGKIRENEKLAGEVKFFLQEVFGLSLEPFEEAAEITPQIQELLEQREQARKDKNWSLADEIRDQLMVLGWEVRDEKS